MRALVVLMPVVALPASAHDVGAQQDISGQWRLGARSAEGLPAFAMNSVVDVGSYTSGTWAAERMPGAGGDAAPDPAATDLPNPNPTVIRAWGQLPEGRAWGTSAGVEIGPDGHIWTYDRCGQTAFADVCSTSTVDPILKLDRMTGEVLASWAAGMFAFPHGIHVDGEGNVWITDSMANEAGTVGHQVIKFSPEGEILMTLGRAGVAGRDRFRGPWQAVGSPNT